MLNNKFLYCALVFPGEPDKVKAVGQIKVYLLFCCFTYVFMIYLPAADVCDG